MYYLYGFTFLYETYLYHIIRKDHRHNFSVYFYQLYLTSENSDQIFGEYLGIIAFIPQLLLILAFTHKFSKDLIFSMFLQTFTFVAFNKVCTVQYFIWYFSILPLIIHDSSLTKFKSAILFLLWFVSQLAWLIQAYYLEFEGKNTFF